MSKIVRNTILYTIGNILPQAVGFLLLPVYTRYLTPSDYGIVASMGALGTIIVVFLSLCLERSVYRLFYDYKDTKDKRDFLGTIFISLAANSLIMIILIFIFKDLVSKTFTSIDFYPYYVYTILSSFFTIFYFIPSSYFQITENARNFVILSLGKFLLTTFLTLWYVVKLHAGAEGQIKAGLISNLVLFPIFLFLTTKMVNYTLKLDVLKKALLFSIPLVPNIIASWALSMSNRIFIERYFNLSDVGIYSLGNTLATVALTITNGFEIAYLPHFFKLANSDDVVGNRKRLEKSNNIYALVMLLIVFAIALVSKELVTFFMDVRYREVYKITRIIAFSYYFMGLGGIVTLSILQEKKTKQNMYMAVAAALVNALLNFLLIPRFGMYGAAYATFLTFSIGFLVQYQYSKFCYFIPLHLKKIFGLYILTGLIIFFYQLILEKYFYISLLSKILLLTVACWIILSKVLGVKSLDQLSLSRIFGN